MYIISIFEVYQVFPLISAAQIIDDQNIINAHEVELVNKTTADKSSAAGNYVQFNTPFLV